MPVMRHEVVANGLATAMLAGPWERRGMRTRTRTALGRSRAPVWLAELVDDVLGHYRDAPADRPRQLADYLVGTPAWRKAWTHRRPPQIVAWAPVPTSVGPSRWPVTALADLTALARLLDVDQGELAWFADVRGLERRAAAPLRHYRWTVLPRPGGARLVAAPKPRLKEIQRRLLRHVLAPIPVHPAAHGCVPGRSVGTALAPHAGRPLVVRVDLENFFAGIRPGRVWGVLRSAGLPEAVAHTMTGLVTTVAPREVTATLPFPQRARLGAPHLPIGAPSSAALANLVAFSLDRRLTGLAARFGMSYTRYVDDLTFSGANGAERLLDGVARVVADEGFRLNGSKTVVLGAAGRQQLLGAVVNDHPTLPRRERDRLRAILHNCAVRGWRSQGGPELRGELLGRISWAGGLDPVLGARLRAAFDAVEWT